MSIRKSFYKLSQDYFFPAQTRLAKQGFIERAGHQMQASAYCGEIGKGALRLQETEQTGSGRFFFLHGCSSLLFCKNESVLREKQQLLRGKKGSRSEKNIFFNHLFRKPEH